MVSKTSATQRRCRNIALIRSSALLQGIEPAPKQASVRSEVRLDLLPNLVAIHMDREVAFFAELDGRLRILVRQPPESAGGPNGCVRRCSADILQCREHLLTGFPNRFVRIDQPQDSAVALH